MYHRAPLSSTRKHPLLEFESRHPDIIQPVSLQFRGTGRCHSGVEWPRLPQKWPRNCWTLAVVTDTVRNWPAFSALLADESDPGVGGFGVHCGVHMAVDIERDRDRRVAETLLDDLGVHASLQRQRGQVCRRPWIESFGIA